MNTIIYWFSGTGNSLYAAKRLAEELGDTVLFPITNEVSVSESVGGDKSRIGFAFPSYYGDLPRIVRAFVEKLNILPETDIFTVVTMGAMGQGSIKAMSVLLSQKGLQLRYGMGVRMPSNYILSYDPALFGAKSIGRMNRKLKKADKKIQSIAEAIVSKKQKIKTSLITAKTLYTNIPALDADFFVMEGCTGCGLCEKVCPVQNIEFISGKPVWTHHCEHCVSCISWCPVGAIEYGQKTKKRTRYHNLHVKPVEMERTR